MKIPTSLAIFALVCGCSMQAQADDRELSCKLEFMSREWSALYQSAVGSGTVTCKDGSSMAVDIRARGIGVTAGKWKIANGVGTFTHVAKIDDVLGSYLAISGQIGLYKTGTAQIMTRWHVSLALAGKGEGFDVGVAVSDFTISKASGPESPKSASKGNGKSL